MSLHGWKNARLGGIRPGAALFLCGPAVIACMACLLWAWAPLVAPGLVIRYCPWDEPWCRAVQAQAVTGNDLEISDTQLAAASVGLRYDRLLRQALDDRQSLTTLLSLADQGVFVGAAGDEYAQDLMDLLLNQGDGYFMSVVEEIPDSAQHEVLGRYLPYSAGLSVDGEFSSEFTFNHPKVARMIENAYWGPQSAPTRVVSVD